MTGYLVYVQIYLNDLAKIGLERLANLDQWVNLLKDRETPIGTASAKFCELPWNLTSDVYRGSTLTT